MNKELEYLEEIQNELDKNPRDKWKAYWNGKCNFIRQALTPPNLDELRDEIIKELVPQYENWYARFNKIEVDETGVYAICKKPNGDMWARYIIFKIIYDEPNELKFETHTCSHLTLDYLNKITTYFKLLSEEKDNE